MKNNDSISNERDLKAEVKRLQKQVAQLESQNKKFEDKIANRRRTNCLKRRIGSLKKKTRREQR